MKTLLHKLKLFSIVIFLFVIYGNVNAQCSITTLGTVNSSTLVCHISPLNVCDNGTLTIGDGSSITKIYMDAELDLRCLGAIQVIVKNKGAFDFSPGNNRLYLAEGSFITFESGSDLIGGSCNASERIYIGTNLLASCNGGAGADLSFADLLAYGGTGSLASNSPVCVGSQITLTATPPPTSTGTFTYSFSGPGLAATSFSSSPTYSFTATAGSSGLYQVKIKNSNIVNPLIAEISVTVNSLPTTPTITAGGPTTFCVGGSVTLTSSVGTNYLWSTGATTASISPTSSGSYTVNVTSASNCQSAPSSAIVVTVNPNLPASISIGASPSGAICSGTSVTFTAAPTNGGVTPAYQWILNGGDVGTNSATYTNSALANGDVVTCVMTSNATSCLTGSPATSGAITMTVNATPVKPVLSDIVLSCSATSFAIGTLTLPPGIIDYKVDVSKDMIFSAFGLIVSDFSLGGISPWVTNVTGLTPGATYYVRVRAVSGCGTSANSNIVTASVLVTRTTDGGLTWDNGVSNNTKKAVFTGSATMSTPLDACSCQINSGVNVVVGVPGGSNDTAILKLENGLDVLGNLTFENNASLVQVNDAAVNTGNIIYKRNTTPMKNYDYTYWSSPVAGQTLQALSPNTLSDKYFSYSLNTWVTHLYGLSTMIVGKGYIIRVPKPDITYPNGEYWTGTTYVQSVQFVGVPNNGAHSLAIDPTGYSNLIGNPYPCAMSADAFLFENSIDNARIEGTIRLWTHNTVITNNKYSATDFASYNYVGGVGTAAPSASTGGINTSIPSGYIAAGQSFMTKSTGGGSVVFNNSMRVSLANKNAQFFKGTKSKIVAIEKHRVWLDLTNTEGAFKQMLVGYVTGGTNEFDSAFDGVSLNSNKYIDFYSINDNKNYVIQGRALPFEKADKVPLGYKTTIEGTFAISIDQADGILADESIFVEDKVKGIIVDLRKGPYSFNTAIGTFNDRFVLRFTDNADIAKVFNTANLDKKVIVSVQNHQIKIDSFDEIIDKLMVYDLNGRLLYEKENVNSNVFSIPNFNSSEQFLIVQTLLKNGEWVTTEIVF
ncbi:T9SS sorting signal type C domain-containing protein [Flavobacterium laiguense]|uniref:Fibronectin type-III domain-containing protein n=1 Tax=Flavobacterium laiguense TaxID=2169409 RepID=A0A2U1K3K4_9FLAO|nr:T9SS sorting signal type C domain-containing protein [Flavobacterium laiguense]PWA11729.1 hypothetical protein DB891_02685 [Flavobacterium laiguense]